MLSGVRLASRLIVLAVVCPLWVASGAQAQIEAYSSRNHDIDHDWLMQDIYHETVQIKGRKRTAEGRLVSDGAGVVMSVSGHIMTALHVVDGFDDLEVISADGQVLSAKTIAVDRSLDIAIIKASIQRPLRPAYFKRPLAQEQGDEIVSIGNPGGKGQTVLTGKLNNIKKVQWSKHENSLRSIEVPIVEGFSGGGSYDLDTGELVGLNVARGFDGKTGFLVPIAFVGKFALEKIQSEEAEYFMRVRKQLGVYGRRVKLRDGDTYKFGTLITAIENGPARAANWRCGDILVGLNGYKLNTGYDFEYTMAQVERDEVDMPFILLRQGEYVRGHIRPLAAKTALAALSTNYLQAFSPDEWTRRQSTSGAAPADFAKQVTSLRHEPEKLTAEEAARTGKRARKP